MGGNLLTLCLSRANTVEDVGELREEFGSEECGVSILNERKIEKLANVENYNTKNLRGYKLCNILRLGEIAAEEIPLTFLWVSL